MAQVIWFKRRAYAGKNSRGAVPLWHISAKDYDPGRTYWFYTAICGYLYTQGPLSDDIQMSAAEKPRGGLCKKCLKKSEAKH